MYLIKIEGLIIQRAGGKVIFVWKVHGRNTEQGARTSIGQLPMK